MAWTLICAETTIAFTNAYINNICINIDLCTTPISLTLTQDYQVIQQQFVTDCTCDMLQGKHAMCQPYWSDPDSLQSMSTPRTWREGNGQPLGGAKLANQQGVIAQQTFSLQVTLTCARKNANGKINRIICLAQVKSFPDDCYSLKEKHRPLQRY